MKLVNMTPHPVRIYGADTPDRVEDPDDGASRW